MNNPIQAPIIQSGRLNHLLDLVFADALRMAEKEENYELCSKLHNFIKEKRKEDDNMTQSVNK